MSTEKKENTAFIFKIILITILLILAFAGVIVSGIILASKGFDPIYLSILTISLVFCYVFGKLIMHTIEAWSTNKIERIKSGGIQRITTWTLEKEIWADFIAWKKKDDVAKVKSTAIWTFLIGLAVFTFMAYSSFDWVTLTMVVTSGAIAFSALISGLIHLGSKYQLQKIAGKEMGEIIFTEKTILMNNLLISFNEMGINLAEIRICDIDNWHLLEVAIESGIEDRKNTTLYHIPIPSDKEAEAAKLMVMYQKLL